MYVRNAAPYFDALKNNMPEGMRAVGGVGNGVFEVVQDLTGYENLCLMSFDNEKLYHAVFQKAGELLFRIWELVFGKLCRCLLRLSFWRRSGL